MNKQKTNKLKEIAVYVFPKTRHEEKNEKLVAANGSLLQQVPVATSKPETEEEEKTKNFNFYDMFDKYGHFK